MKVCSAGCSKKPKPLADYHRKANAKDGHAPRCKGCTSESRKARRLVNIAEEREYDRMRDRYRLAYRANWQRARRARLKQTTTTTQHKATL